MIKRKRFPNVFFGWWMNLVTGIISGLGDGFFLYGISALFKPIASDLGLNRAATSIATGIGRIQIGITSPFIGFLADRFGPRWLIVSGLCIMSTGLVLMNFINSSWSYYIVWGVLVGIGNGLANMLVIDKALANWFISKRGLAIGVRFFIMGICAAIVVPAVTSLVISEGWRITCLIWAGLMFIGVPLSWYFVKPKRPEYYGLLPDGATIESGLEADVDGLINKGVEYAESLHETEFTLRETIKTRAYWLLIISFICSATVTGGFNVHCIPFLTDMGIDQIVAGALMSMMVFFTIPARFLGGFLTDRVRKERLHLLLVASFLLQTAGLTAFILHQSITTVYVLLILYGFGHGPQIPLKLAIIGRYFGRKAFASIQGTTIMFEAIGGTLAPIYAGWVFDTTGSYIIAFITFAALSTAVAFLLLLVRPPKPLKQGTDIYKIV